MKTFVFKNTLRLLPSFDTQFSVCKLPDNVHDDSKLGGKIIMPPSVLEILLKTNIYSSKLFKLKNEKTNKVTHCGVLGFTAEEGKVYLPNWMMRQLLVEEKDLISIESVVLPVANYTYLQPQSEDFLDIKNPGDVVANELRKFVCLTIGDVIQIKYNERIYEMCVLVTKPGSAHSAVSIVECDMTVYISPPVEYEEPKSTKPWCQHSVDSKNHDTSNAITSPVELDKVESKDDHQQLSKEVSNENRTEIQKFMSDFIDMIIKRQENSTKKDIS